MTESQCESWMKSLKRNSQNRVPGALRDDPVSWHSAGSKLYFACKLSAGLAAGKPYLRYRFMINLKKATQLAEEWIAKESIQYDFVLLYEHTLEFEYGWVFFYQTKEYVQTGDISKMTGENAPVIIDKTNGSLHVTGTELPVEKYIRDYIRKKNESSGC